MSWIPDSVTRVLADPRYVRGNAAEARAALQRLGITEGAAVDFFERYAGPFWSASRGYEVLDPCRGRQTIASVTEICRRVHGFQMTHVALTDLAAGHQIVVLDLVDGQIREVDFEGGVEELLSGNLEPRWPDFRIFVEDLLAENGD